LQALQPLDVVGSRPKGIEHALASFDVRTPPLDAEAGDQVLKPKPWRSRRPSPRSRGSAMISSAAIGQPIAA
jgi:hypothetical protein